MPELVFLKGMFYEEKMNEYNLLLKIKGSYYMNNNLIIRAKAFGTLW